MRKKSKHKKKYWLRIDKNHVWKTIKGTPKSKLNLIIISTPHREITRNYKEIVIKTSRYS